jgi:hypothetical protein
VREARERRLDVGVAARFGVEQRVPARAQRSRDLRADILSVERRCR